MSQKWFNGLNLQQNQLENAVIQNLASDPSSGKAGQIYYNTTDNGYRYYNGTAWVSISADAIKSIVAGNGLTSSTSGNAVTLTLGTPSTSGATSGNTLGDNSVTENSHTHQICIPTASTIERGIIQLATDTEATTGTETKKAVTPKQLATAKQEAINSAKVTIQTSDGLTGGSSTPATSFTLGLSDSGVAADTYNNVTVDAKGRVTKGLNKSYVETSALDDYQKKQDNTLNTTVKTVVGAINEVRGTADAANATATTNATEITNIKNGTTVVGKANKVANPLTISDGTNSITYDGSAARTLQFKPEDFSESTSGGTATVALIDKGYATKTYVDTQDDKKLDKAGGIITGDLTIGGNVTVNGTTTTVNSNTLTVKDKLIEVAKDNTTTLTSPAGIIVPRYNGTEDYGALVIDSDGNAKVGDVKLKADGDIDVNNSDLQTLATRTGLQDGQLVKWDDTQKTLVPDTTVASNASSALSKANANTTEIINIKNGTTKVGKADKLTTARTISLSGDATGSTTFDGSANKDINVTLSNTGVAAGTYNTVTVDAKGRVTAAMNTQNSQVTEITGDGVKTVFDIAHTLGKDVLVQVFLNGQQVGADTVDELVSVDVFTANNKVKLVFATAPKTTEKFKVVISSGGSVGGGGSSGGGSALAKIYGVDKVGSENPDALVRTDDAVGLNVTVGTSEITSDFDNCYPWCDMQEVTDASGNVFIKIPKFYSKITKNADGTYKHQLSGIRYEGFSTLFVDGLGFEIDGVLVGKYEGSGSSERVYSKSGQTVLTRITCDNFRTACKANGAGYQQYDFLIDLIIKELWLIEMKTTNCQSIMYGYVNNNSAATNTGATDSVITPSGSPVSNTDGKHACKYRGIENLWGNIFIWCDGISFSSDKVYVCTDPASYTAGKIDAPYVYQGNCPVGDGWIKKVEPLGRNPLIQYVTEIARVGNTPYFYDYMNVSGSVLAVGGAWSDARYAGLWYWAASYSPSDTYLPIGGRLCYKPR